MHAIDILHKSKEHFYAIIGIIIFIGLSFSYWQNIVNIWESPQIVKKLEKRISLLEGQSCNILLLHKSSVLTSATTFQSILYITDAHNTQAIEIIKSNSKNAIQTHIQEIQKLEKRCER